MAAAMLDVALSHFRAKRTAQAVAAFDNALRDFSAHGGLDTAQQEMAHSMRGDCHAILGHFQLAEDDFSRSIELAPGVAIYHYKRGSARRKLGDQGGAVADLRRSVEMGCGMGKAALKQLDVFPAGPSASSSHPHNVCSDTVSTANKILPPDASPTSTALHETAEAEAVRAQLEIVEREQQRLASLTARVVNVALTDGKRERSGRRAAEQAAEAERQRAEHAMAKAQRERERAKSERRAAKRANAVALASVEEVTRARADAAEQRERVGQYLLCAQAEIRATEREASRRAAALVKQSEKRDVARQEQAARQQAAATAVLRKERAARTAAAGAQARAEARLQQAEVELATAQQHVAAATAAATVVSAGADAARVGSASGGECVVCLDAPKEIMLEPCHHVCLCAACASRVRDCPVCRSKVRRRVRLYI